MGEPMERAHSVREGRLYAVVSIGSRSRYGTAMHPHGNRPSSKWYLLQQQKPRKRIFALHLISSNREAEFFEPNLWQPHFSLPRKAMIDSPSCGRTFLPTLFHLILQQRDGKQSGLVSK